jgi:hypothetical protein
MSLTLIKRAKKDNEVMKVCFLTQPLALSIQGGISPQVTIFHMNNAVSDIQNPVVVGNH